MKQYITEEQIEEYIDGKTVDGIYTCNLDKNEDLNLLLGRESRRNFPPPYRFTIGKMTEFVSENLKANAALRIACEEVVDVDYPGKMMWFVSIVEYEEAEEDLHEHCIQFQEDELCDALWKAAKFILTEEEKC